MADKRVAPLPAVVARSALLGLLLLFLAALATRPPKPAAMPKEQGDVGLYTTVVQQGRAGTPYYDALGRELRRRGYPTASVFNWRMPLVMRALAVVPRPTRITFLILGLACIIATLLIGIRQPPEVLAVSLLAQIGVVIPIVTVPEYIVMSEAWCGFLIVLSLAAYARGWAAAAAAFGVLALFARELAAPYCAVCGVLALRSGRWRESTVWALGAVAFGAYFAAHAFQVHAQLGAQDIAQKQSWLQFGGLPFLLRTIAFTGWYDALPLWTRPVGLVLLAAAPWAGNAPVQLRVTVALYLVFLAVVGQAFNQYWGLVAGPAWAVGYGFGIAGLQRLITSARAAGPSASG